MKSILLAATAFFALSGAMPTYHQYKPPTIHHNPTRDATILESHNRRQPAHQPVASFLDVPVRRSLADIVHNIERAPAPLYTVFPRSADKPHEYQPNEKRAPRYRPHSVSAKRQEIPAVEARAPAYTVLPRGEDGPHEYQPNEKRAPRYQPHKVEAKR